MSVSSVSLPNPASYSYPNDLPAGLAASQATASTGTTSATPTAPKISVYQASYNSLLAQDASELLQVSFATPEQANENVANVLAQAAKLQAIQQANAQIQAQNDEAAGFAKVDAAATAALNVPSIESVIGQSDTAAQAVLGSYIKGGTGSILDYQG